MKAAAVAAFFREKTLPPAWLLWINDVPVPHRGSEALGSPYPSPARWKGLLF